MRITSEKWKPSVSLLKFEVGAMLQPLTCHNEGVLIEDEYDSCSAPTVKDQRKIVFQS